MQKRKEWKECIDLININKIFFLDESSVNCGMTRLYGRAFSNERINDYVPDIRFERTSIMGVLGLKGIIAPLVYKGTLNGELFGVYVKENLTPAMNEGDILVLDNLSVHKVKGVLQPLIDKGIHILFLPPYSPDFNPIELAWSKIKSILRKIKARTIDTLFPAITIALDSLTQEDIIAWFNHCCHGLQ